MEKQIKFSNAQIEQESFATATKKLAPLHAVGILSGAALAGYSAYIAHYPTIIPFLSFAAIGALALGLSKNENGDEIESIGVRNVEGERYFTHVGNVVKEIKGDTRKTAPPDNVRYPVLLDNAMHSTHYAIIGTTGSGKTVTMQNLMEEILESGGGFIFVDGKGSSSMIRTIYALAAKYHREHDFQIINFSNHKLSDTLDFFSLSIDDITRILRIVLEDKTSKSPEWGQYGEGISVNVARVLKYLDERGEFFDTAEMERILRAGKKPDKINTKRSNFVDFFEYFGHNNAFKLLHTLKLLKVDYEVWKPLEDFFVQASKCTVDDIYGEPEVKADDESVNKLTYLQKIELKYKQNREKIKQFEYAWNVGSGYWSETRDKILSEYRNIFTFAADEAPAVNIPATISLHKILYYVLPGTAAQSNVRFASNILFANIRSHYETLKDGRTLAIPFTIFLDEMNSWAHTVEGIGALMSQTREQRLAFVCGYQTDLKLDDKGREASMIWGNANTKILLKTDDPELLDKINKNFDEQTEVISDDNDKERVQREKRQKFMKDEIRKLKPGESFIIRGEHIAPFVSKYRPPIIYKPDEQGLPETDRYALPPVE